MTETTRRVTQWIIGVRGEVPLVEELATPEDVQSFVRGHVRWVDGTPGPAIELEDIDLTTVDWYFVQFSGYIIKIWDSTAKCR